MRKGGSSARGLGRPWGLDRNCLCPPPPSKPCRVHLPFVSLWVLFSLVLCR